MIDIAPHALETIQRILATRVPNAEVRAFGSRYTWNSKDYSDLDLAIVGERPLTLSEMGRLREDFQESDLPFRVDVLDWHTLSPEFRRVIEEGYAVIQKRGVDKNSSGWKDARLGALVEINAQSITSNFPFDEIEYIDTASVTQNRFDPFQKLKLSDAPSRAKRIVRAGDTILSTVRPIQRHFGFIKNPNRNTIASTGFVVLTPQKIHPEFLYYYLSQDSITSYLDGVAETTTTTFPAFRPDTLADLEIVIPEKIETQQRIASILSALDDKIELNRQTNATLEAIAQAIFQEWFVENKDVADWDAVSLPEIIAVNPSRPLKKGEVAPYLDMANMPTQGHRAMEWFDRPFGSGTRFMNGDTLLARITPCLENGKTAFVDFLTEGQTGWGSTEYIVLRPKPPLPPEYGYFIARSTSLRNHAIQNMIGTSGRQRTPSSAFDNFIMSVPPVEMAIRFGEIANALSLQIKANDEESRTFAQIRDHLLPKLMNGEIRV